jgi:outer membrane lipoprotein carrier protein
MKLLISYILSIFIFVLSLSANNDIENIDTFEASFSQSIVNSSGKEILYDGEIFIKQPSNILWRYLDPIEKLVYINNRNVTIIEPDLEQAIISKLEKEINILELVQTAVKIDNNLYKSTLDNKEYILLIKDNKLTQIKYLDDIENKVTISFNKIKQNQNISPEIFKFNIPYDYDIIKK